MLQRALLGAVALLALAACQPARESEAGHVGASTRTQGGFPSGYSGFKSVADDRAEQVAHAKAEFESAAQDLRDAVDALRYTSWSQQMWEIRNRLDAADAALIELEAVSPGDPAVINARMSVDQMHADLGRLYTENWRHVRPDLETSSISIDDEAQSVSDEPED